MARKKKDHDFAVNAFRIVQEATEKAEEVQAESGPTAEERHNAAVILGRKGGQKGGKARAEKLTPERRQEIARQAANARWNHP